jgi:hypothetical protein
VLKCVSSDVIPSRFLYFHNCKSVLYYLKLAMDVVGTNSVGAVAMLFPVVLPVKTLNDLNGFLRGH